jgi:sec-independent protein translocase protein TatB
MFDLGFSELLVIGVVALIVIGPERLPKVARTAGAWIGRLNRYVSDVKGDIDREMRLEELRKLQDEMKASAQKYEIMASEAGQEVKREVDQVDKVIQAMAATDGGLSLRAYEETKAEAARVADAENAGEAAGMAELNSALPDQAAAPDPVVGPVQPDGPGRPERDQAA